MAGQRTGILSREHAEHVHEIVREVSLSEIMPRFTGRTRYNQTVKTSAFDIVTDADEAAESALTNRLGHLFPNAAFLGEDAAARDPDMHRRALQAELCVIIDPLDGTKNFASSLPLFGTMVAVLVNGEVALAVIYDPISDDACLAVRGVGAWKRHGSGSDENLRVSRGGTLSSLQGVAGVNFVAPPLLDRFMHGMSKVALTFWLRCAAHEYRMAAAGHCDFLIYNRMMPWDHAAGWLLHREAGGHSARFDGSPYDPAQLDGGLILAPDLASWEALRDAFIESGAGREPAA
ncbi:MAG TPA: inositol monophosphatase [Paracoccus sp.]|nr:inositol monophosphatase [Paracoccus sp. (in: a-proteobacteria)]